MPARARSSFLTNRKAIVGLAKLGAGCWAPEIRGRTLNNAIRRLHAHYFEHGNKDTRALRSALCFLINYYLAFNRCVSASAGCSGNPRALGICSGGGASERSSHVFTDVTLG